LDVSRQNFVPRRQLSFGSNSVATIFEVGVDLTVKLNLENVPLFADASADDRESLLQAMRSQRIRQGERLFNIGDGSEALYIIDIGWVKLLDADGMVVANLGPSNMFGETEVLAGKPREMQAVAATDVSIWVLNAGDLDRLVSESLDLGLALSKSFGARVAQLTRYLGEERLKPVPFLFELESDGLAEVANKLTLERYTRGSFLFHRGGWARALFLIESGEINLVMSEPGAPIATIPLLPGAVVGEIALLTGKPYTFTAEVEADATVWALGRDDFESLCDRYPSIRLILSRSMSMAPRSVDSSAALEHLRAIPLFADLPESALTAVAQRFILRHVPAGELVYAEGSPGEAMYIVDGGEVEVMSSSGQEREAIAHLHDGEYFGETALLTGRSRTAAVRAVAHSNLWALYRSDFDELMLHYPAIRQALNRTLGRELSEAGRRPNVMEGELSAAGDRRSSDGAYAPAPRSAEERRTQRETQVDPTGWTGHSNARRPVSDSEPEEVSAADTEPSRAEIVRQDSRLDRKPTGRDRDAAEPAARDQKTEEFHLSTVEPDAVPSRYRDEFVRPAAGQRSPAARAEGATGRTDAQTPVRNRQATDRQERATAPRAGQSRQQTVAQVPVPLGKAGASAAADDGDHPRGPRRLARWFADLSLQGKLRLVGLLLIFIWFACIVPPAFVIKSSNISVLGALSGLVAGESTPAVAEEPPVDPSTGEQTASEPATDAAASGADAAPAPTDTPAPTNTPPASPTPAATNTSVPPTDTPAPLATPTVAPTATPNNSGVVQADIAWVRGGPSAAFKAVAKLSSGDKVTLLGRGADGAWVQVKTSDGTQGWAEARYIDTAVKVEALALAESPDTPTPKATEAKAAKPSPSPTGPTMTPTTAVTPTPAIKYTAPVQTKPNDGDSVSTGPLAKNYLEWVPLALEADEFYNVTLVYKVNGVDSYFGDSTTEPRYLLPQGLYGAGDQHWYQWRVVVRKATSKSADGKPDGPAISPESGLRRFKWD
jgi:CRP-like cAMP-binding protein